MQGIHTKNVSRRSRYHNENLVHNRSTISILAYLPVSILTYGMKCEIW